MSQRKYPRHPIPAVGAFIVHGGRILLVKRAFEPGAGKWSVPGGAIELGETAEEAVKREVKEELGIGLRDLKLLDIYDSISRDPLGRIKYHYVIIDFLARPSSLDIKPSGEILEYRWTKLDEVEEMETTPSVKKLVAKKAGELEEYLGKNGR